FSAGDNCFRFLDMSLGCVYLGLGHGQGFLALLDHLLFELEFRHHLWNPERRQNIALVNRSADVKLIVPLLHITRDFGDDWRSFKGLNDAGLADLTANRVPRRGHNSDLASGLLP